MLFKRVYAARTVILAVTVAAVDGKGPFLGFSEEVEKKWKALQQRFGLAKERFQKRIQERTLSNKELDISRKVPVRRSTDLSKTLAKFIHMDKSAQDAEAENVFSPHWKPPKFNKSDPTYGRPKKGSLTEKRGIAAGHHVGKEIIQLCEIITEYGTEGENGSVLITFGELFKIYVYISDKVVGMLMRARKHKLVHFEGEMLYQRQDEEKIITLLKSLSEVKALYAQSNDPALCLRTN